MIFLASMHLQSDSVEMHMSSLTDGRKWRILYLPEFPQDSTSNDVAGIGDGAAAETMSKRGQEDGQVQCDEGY